MNAQPDITSAVADAEIPLRMALVMGGLSREDADAAIREHAAEVRAAALEEVADLWMERSTTVTLPRERMDLRNRANELRRMAAAARPDNTGATA